MSFRLFFKASSLCDVVKQMLNLDLGDLPWESDIGSVYRTDLVCLFLARASAINRLSAAERNGNKASQQAQRTQRRLEQGLKKKSPFWAPRGKRTA